MTAEALDADVVVVGSGIAGAMLAYKLNQAGARVVVLEAGPDVTRAELHDRLLSKRVYTPVDLDPRVDYAPTTHPDNPNAYLINTGNVSYNPHMTKAVGGTTWHWSGGCHRFEDEDLRLKTTHGVGVDWPIDYRELEPFYAQAEREMGVSVPSDSIDPARRSTEPAMRDFVWPYMYSRLRDVLKPHGYTLKTHSYARNTQEYDGRPACRGNNMCWPLCPIGAQYNAIVHVNKARELGTEVRAQSLVTRLELGKEGRIQAAVYRKPDGTQARVRAKIFVLCANGIETPKLLLASRSAAAPNGVANGSSQVGQNFMEHPVVSTQALSSEALYPGRGPIAFGVIDGYSYGKFRSKRAAATFAIDNRMSVDEVTGDLLKEGHRGDALSREIKFRTARILRFNSELEMLPESGSSISLDWDQRDSAGQPRARVTLKYDDYTQQGLDFMVGEHNKVANSIGVLSKKTQMGIYFGNHPMGATRMGNDARSSVVDPDCRSHENANLFIASSSVFPTGGGFGGPTFTIAALALRTATVVLKQLGET